MRRRQSTGEPAEPMPALETAEALRNAVARLIAEIYTGKLHHRLASGLAPLLNLQLRAIETTNLEKRLAAVEKLVAAMNPEK